MPSPTDRMTCHPEQRQDDADHHYNNAYSPDDGNLRDKSDNEQNNAENDQIGLLTRVAILWPWYLAGTGLYS